jgi:hypothetical protein
MNNNKESFLKTDDNKIINERCIRWVKKMNDCLEVCTKSNGCEDTATATHKICKSTNLNSYNKLDQYFK